MNTVHRWYCRSGHWRRTVRERLLPWVLGDVEVSGRVLEIGPGPGVTTEWLAERVENLTAVEIDPMLATSLRQRVGGEGVEVIEADATQLPLPDDCFDTVVCFTMMHHIPSASLQDAMFREVRRVLKPSGSFLGSDSTSSFVFRLAHLADTMVMVDPDTLPARLKAAGFDVAGAQPGSGAFRFRAA